MASRDYTIEIDAGKTGHPVSDMMYGVFFEDINYAGDGGLYPELVQNRSFEYRPLSNVGSIDQAGTAWSFGYGGKDGGSYAFSREDGLSDRNPTYLKVSVSGTYCISNRGYSDDEAHPDIPVRGGAVYHLSLYARNVSCTGTVCVGVTSEDGGALTDVRELSFSETGGWVKYDAYRLTGVRTGTGRLVVTLSGEGEIDLDFISLMPTDTWGYGKSTWKYGGLRTDLVEAVAALNPSFIRFPGGCIVEGRYTHAQAYHWKDTIGAPETRRENPDLRGYMQSYGLGYHEYFQLCRDLGAEPLPIIYAGMLCQAGDKLEHAKYERNFVPGDPGLDDLAQEIIDLVEYANGAADTEWGAKRAENGQPEPFDLKYIGIGNENFTEAYFTNLAYLKKKVEAACPDITIVSSAGLSMSGEHFEYALARVSHDFTDTIIDMHRYASTSELIDLAHFFDGYDRSGAKVFMGEYAAHDAEKKNSLQAALAEAVFLTGLEKNTDVVVMSAYAPLFGKTGMAQWWPNLIWFSSAGVSLTPNYYVQKLFSQSAGTVAMDAQVSGPDELYQSVTLDEKKNKLYVKVVNPDAVAKQVTIRFDGFQLPSRADATILTDTCGESTVCAPKAYTVKLRSNEIAETLAPYAFVVYELDLSVPAD